MQPRRLLLLILFFSLPHITWAATVGVFSDVSGDVQILRGATYYQAATGVRVNQQDIIVTGDNASAQLDLKDGSSLSIANNSRVLLSDYQLRDDNSVLRASISVLSGWLRFAVSKLHGDSTYAFNTPVMTIGIRGTQGVIEAQSGDGSLMLDEGHVRVHGIDANGNEKSGVETLSTGQFLSRARGGTFERRLGAPSGFLNRLPPRMTMRLVWHARFLRMRGVRPQRVRSMGRGDLMRMLEMHPAMRKLLRRRFQAKWGDDPAFRRVFGEQRAQSHSHSRLWRLRRRREFRRRERRRLLEN